jgi:broad specificity phosphatase PhoE
VDIPLNAQGREQARALADLLRRDPFDRIISSDLSRALATAEIIAPDRPIERDARWREFAFGQWEGLTWEQIVKRWPQAGAEPSAAARYAPPGGETFPHLRTRVGAALQQLRGGNERHIVIVTHAGPLHAALHELFADRADMHELLGLRFVPASITKLRLSGQGAELVTLNDVAHLM